MVKKGVFVFILLGFILSPLGNIYAKQFEIDSKDVERIKLAFSFVGALANIGAPDALKNILNTALRGGETTVDITYGLLILSAMNETELIDLVMSQRYKALSTKYFNEMLDQRADMFGFYKGVGLDIVKVAFGNISSPISALSLNTFSIGNKTIQAVIGLYALERTMIYNGLHVYLNDRITNETHETAWYEATTQIGIGTINSKFRKSSKSNDTVSTLEQYFATLWDKWGPYTTQAGVTEDAKRQFKAEMDGLLVEATQEYTLAQAKKEAASPLLFERLLQNIRALGKSVGDQIGKLADILNKIAVQIGNKLGATIATTTKPEQTPEKITEEPLAVQKDQQQSEIAQLPKPSTPVAPTQPQQQEILLETPPVIEENIVELEEVVIESKSDKLACAIQANTSPNLQSLILSEIAWMGTSNSANDEWIELKNISRQEIALTNWQLQDKDGQIHFVFPNVTIQPQSFYLLERTDDSTLPDITADAIYKGGLSNSDEALYLFDENCQLQDKVEANPKWPDGDVEKKIPMERTMDLQWRTAPSPSPRAENTKSFGPGVFFSSNTNTNGGGGSAPNPVTYSKILITEIRTASQSSQTDEFVELYNPNNEAVDLTSWYLQKKTAAASEFSTFTSNTLFAQKQIAAHGYLLIAREGSSFAAQADIITTGALADNNTIALKNPTGSIVDKVGWGQVQDAETSPAQNPSSSQALARIWQEANQEYQDTDNNSMDFQLHNPGTPKAQNAQPPPEPPPEEPDPEPTPSQLVVFNEIAWMGTTISADDEWIELLSTVTNTTTNVTGWRIAAEDGTPNITLSGTINPQGYYLLERTADTTISDISANKIYTGALGNEGELLRLFDAQDNLIDAIDASSGWFAGNNTTKQSMERISASVLGSTATNWANNNLMSVNGKAADNIAKINGTPGQQNSVSKSQTALGNTTNFRLNEFDAVTLTLLGSPYITTGQLTIPQNKTLTIEPGVIIRFENNTSKIIVNGTLQAIGTSDTKITFTGALTLSHWCGLEFNSTSQNSALEHTVIERAAGCGIVRRSIMVDGSSITLKNSSFVSGDWKRRIYLKNSNSIIDTVAISGANNPVDPDATGILIEGGSPTITNSTFSDNHIGIWNKFPSGTPTITNNTFTGHTYPIKLSSSQATLSGNAASNSTYNAILLEGAATTNLTLQADAIPYITDSYTVNAGKTLTIQQGTIIKFAEIGFDGPTLTVNGNLVVQGAPGNPVTFTAVGDNEVGGTTATGNQAIQSWRRMLFTSGSTGTFDHVVIKRGGNSVFNEGMLQVGQSGQAQSPTLQLSNGTIQQAGKHALYAFDANITIENSSFEVPASSYAFGIQYGNCPTFTNVTVTGPGQTFVPNLTDCPLP